MRTLLLRHPVWVVELAMLSVLVGVGGVSLKPSDRSMEGVGSGNVQGMSLRPVTIRGDVRTPITLGVFAPLDLSLDNPNEFPLTIEKVTVTVLEVEAPRADDSHPCSAGDFHVRQLSSAVVLTLAGASIDDLSGMDLPPASWPAVGLLNRPVNQDGCKGAFLTLDYEATGVEVRP